MYVNQFHNFKKTATLLQHVVKKATTKLHVAVTWWSIRIMKLINIDKQKNLSSRQGRKVVLFRGTTFIYKKDTSSLYTQIGNGNEPTSPTLMFKEAVSRATF